MLTTWEKALVFILGFGIKNLSLMLYRSLGNWATLRYASAPLRILPLLLHHHLWSTPVLPALPHSLWGSCVSIRWMSNRAATRDPSGHRSVGQTVRAERAGRLVTRRAFTAATALPEPAQEASNSASSRGVLSSPVALHPKEPPDTLAKSRTSPLYRQSKDLTKSLQIYEYIYIDIHIYV